MSEENGLVKTVEEESNVRTREEEGLLYSTSESHFLASGTPEGLKNLVVRHLSEIYNKTMNRVRRPKEERQGDDTSHYFSN